MLPYRYVFVGGLHRSGTSLVARIIAGLPDVASIRDAPVPENEGVYLQGAIPHTARHGAPMQFATDPAQHHVEGSVHDRRATRDRIEADWAPFFGAGSWRVEKSPVNLTRMRLYQQLFPLSQFVVVIRHPEAVAGAVSKWVDAKPADLIDHWIAAHEIVAEDLGFLHNVMVLRYEDLVARPGAWRAALAAFLGISAEGDAPDGIEDRNAAYLGRARLGGGQVEGAARWGYGPGMEVRPFSPHIRHSLNDRREAIRAELR